MSNYMTTYLREGQNIPIPPQSEKINFLQSSYVWWFLIAFLVIVTGWVMILFWNFYP